MDAEKARLRHFYQEERRYVLLGLADGKSLTETTKAFLYQFSDFGSECSELSHKELYKRLYERVRNIERKNDDDIKAIAKLTTVDFIKVLNLDDPNPNDPESLFGDLGVYLRAYYRLWIETPSKMLVDACVDSTGKKRRIYKYLTSERLLILKEVREHMEKWDRGGILQEIPLTDPMYRMHLLEQMFTDTPIKSFLRYSRKLGKNIYKSHDKDLRKILRHARTEEKYLPEEFKGSSFRQTKAVDVKLLKAEEAAELFG